MISILLQKDLFIFLLRTGICFKDALSSYIIFY